MPNPYVIGDRVRYSRAAARGRLACGPQHRRVRWDQRVGTVSNATARATYVLWDNLKWPEQIDTHLLELAQ